MEVTPVHLFPAGGRHRLRPGLDRAHLRPGAPGHVRSGRRERLRPRLQRRQGPAHDLRRRLPAAPSSEFSAFQLRARRHGAAASPFRATPRRSARRCSTAEALALPAYDQCIKASHLFNLLDARGVISVTERAGLHRPRAGPGQGAAAKAGLPAAAMPCRELEPMAELLFELLAEEIPARMQAPRGRGSAAAGRREAGRRLASHSAKAEAFRRRAGWRSWSTGLPLAQPDRERGTRGPARRRAGQRARRASSTPPGLQPRPLRTARAPARDKCCSTSQSSAGRAADRGGAAGDAAPRSCTACPGRNRCAGPCRALRWVRPLHEHRRSLRRQARALSRFDRDVPGRRRATTSRPSLPGARGRSRSTRFRRLPGRSCARRHVVLDAGRAQGASSAAPSAKRRAEACSSRLKDDPALLEEVAGLVEWPVVLMGAIDPAFHGPAARGADRPSMRTHQKYFACLGRATASWRRASCGRQHDAAETAAGDRRRQRARAARAPGGRASSSGTRTASCRSTTRLPKLRSGSSTRSSAPSPTRSERVETLATRAAPPSFPGRRSKRVRAAGLAKADLSSGMVGEFPDCRASWAATTPLHDGESAGRWPMAIAEHYAPLGPNDRCPTRAGQRRRGAGRQDRHAGRLLRHRREADRLEGSLRPAPGRARRHPAHPRESRCDCRSLELFRVAFDHRRPRAVKGAGADLRRRPAGLLRRPPEGAAARGGRAPRPRRRGLRARRNEDDLVRSWRESRRSTRSSRPRTAPICWLAYRRAANIVRIEEKKDGAAYPGASDRSSCGSRPRKARGRARAATRARVRTRLARARPSATAMAALAALRGPVDDFFDAVTVNCRRRARSRANRLRLLAQIRDHPQTRRRLLA